MGVSGSQSTSSSTMKSFLFLTLVTLASARTLKVTEIQHGVCEGSKPALNLDSLAVNPYPIVVKSGQDISFQLHLTLQETVPAGATVSLQMTKKGFIDLPLPCIEIDGLHLGSCALTMFLMVRPVTCP